MVVVTVSVVRATLGGQPHNISALSTHWADVFV